jgi:hypothetical protein
MKSNFKVGQKLFVVEKYDFGHINTYELKISKITRDYLYLDGLDCTIKKDLSIFHHRKRFFEVFISKEAYLIEKQRRRLYQEIKATYFNNYESYNFTLEQLQQIEKLLESFKNT